jgi:DNA-binding MarR family transcriptional regulator
MKKIQDYIESCLFFNTNAFSRLLNKIAENEFKILKLSPAHGTLLLIVFDNPGINPKELSRHLHLTPSTITRFVDALVKKDYVSKKSKGKSVFIHPTENGLSLKSDIAKAYRSLFDQYTLILGKSQATLLSHEINKANSKISNHSVPDG